MNCFKEQNLTVTMEQVRNMNQTLSCTVDCAWMEQLARMEFLYPNLWRGKQTENKDLSRSFMWRNRMFWQQC